MSQFYLDSSFIESCDLCKVMGQCSLYFESAKGTFRPKTSSTRNAGHVKTNRKLIAQIIMMVFTGSKHVRVMLSNESVLF